MTELLRIISSLLPVMVFLVALILLDSYKLVPPRLVILTLAGGALAAGFSLIGNRWIIGNWAIDAVIHSRYIAPVVEETAKAAFVVILFRLHRVGFMVDAAIYGFAVGAGFSLIENVVYLIGSESTNMLVWLIRGFGTAAIHAATMAIFGVVSKSLVDRARRPRWSHYLPGWLAAVTLHSLYNHFIFSPIYSTVMLLIVLPLLFVLVFERSEQLTQNWLGVGFDADQDLLQMLTTGEISKSRIGAYLQALQDRFPGTVVVDMFCLLRIHTELSLRAKGVMMLRQAGIEAQPDPDVREKLEELRYLETSIGKTGKLAIAPFIHTSSRELWQIYTIR